MANRQQIGKTLAQVRKSKQQTQKQLAKRTGINISTLSEIENGRFTGSLDIFERYLDALDFELEIKPKQHQLPDWDELETLFGEDE